VFFATASLIFPSYRKDRMTAFFAGESKIVAVSIRFDLFSLPIHNQKASYLHWTNLRMFSSSNA